jgi:DNA repair protein SbcC/Rad50
MIPIHLTLQGIYSYQEKQSIDFTRLTEANIFGIFGPVGSGKSTILEAITYALYGRTDRLNLSGDNRNYNMMNLKSNELLIELIFKTGKDDSEYMATVKSRRNSKQFDDVKSLDRAAYKKVSNEWVPIDINSLEPIIGLSYENFKRTIIIPQGKFQEFLQLGTKERTQMMKELFNLDKYELFYKVVALETKNNQKVQNLEGQLQGLGEINPEQVRLAGEALLLIKTEIENQSKELIVQQDIEGGLRKLKELSEKIKVLEQSLAQLKAKEPEFLLLEKKINEYEYCRLNFKSLLESGKDIARKILQFEQYIAKDHALLENTTKQLFDLGKDFETIKADFDGKELLKQKAEELLKIKKLHELGSIVVQLNERISKGEEVFNGTVEKINWLKQLQDAVSLAIKILKTQYPDIAQLSKVKDWYTVNGLLLLAQKEIVLELAAVQNDLDEIERQKSMLWEHEALKGLARSDDFNTVATALKAKKAEIKSYIDGLNVEMEHLSIQSKLQEYANNLDEGHPCPLCGALSHPQPLNAQDVSEALVKNRDQKSIHEKAIDAIEQIEKRFSEIATKQGLKKESLADALKKQADQEGKISAHQELFAWEAYKEESKVSEEFAKADQIQSQLKEKEAELEKISKNLEGENLNKDKFSKAIEDFRHQLTASTTESSTLANQIKLFNLNDFENKPASEIEKQKESCLNQYKVIENQYEITNQKITLLQKESHTVAGRLEANRKTLGEEIVLQEAIAERLREQLVQSGYISIQEVEKVLSQPMDVEREKMGIVNFRQSLGFSEKQLFALNNEKGDQKYDEGQHQQVVSWIGQLTDGLKLKNQAQGKLEGDLIKLKADLETQRGLRELVNSLQSRAEDLKTLKQLFKASGFVNYVSSVYLQDLCHSANDRFYKLTRQKLSIEVTEDNNFQVRDFMNGGKVRNVKTLSGGQTFQAALCLALALADNIQKITESSQNFFFLDEGFGSLDKESLETVFDTLKSLRKENRIVGIISHVEEMQQEIDAHLIIRNDEEKGSLIRPGWD